jgi:hypothetical protein
MKADWRIAIKEYRRQKSLGQLEEAGEMPAPLWITAGREAAPGRGKARPESAEGNAAPTGKTGRDRDSPLTEFTIP